MLHATPALPQVALNCPRVRTADLSRGAWLFIWSVRQWLILTQLGQCVGCALSEAYEDSECPGAIADLDELMWRLQRDSKKVFEIHCPADALLSNDERSLLQLVAMPGCGFGARSVERLARSLVADQAPSLCRAAGDYSNKLAVAGLELSGWGEPRLVHGV